MKKFHGIIILLLITFLFVSGCKSKAEAYAFPVEGAEIQAFFSAKQDIKADSEQADFEKEIVLDIENSTGSDVYMDAIYGEWEITEYIGTAMAAPGISATFPRERGGSNELGTTFYVGEDFFEYEESKEDVVLFCNILPMSYSPEEIYFLPNGMNMKELGIEGEYFIFIYADGENEEIRFILKDCEHLILWYKQDLYLCERLSKSEWRQAGSFMEVSIADNMSGYCSLYQHKWEIIKEIPYSGQDKENKHKVIEFTYAHDGYVRVITENGNNIRLNARVSYINNWDGSGVVKGYGTFDELGLKGDFITYISLDTTGTEVEWMKGFFIISEDRILLHGDHVLYESIRVSEKIKPEDIRLL